MRHPTRLVAITLSVALSLVACESEPPAPGEHPCAPTWGPTPDSGALYVDEAASSSGDGSLAAPYLTLDEALATSRLGGERLIAVAPGTYEPDPAERRFTLWNDASGATDQDDGLVVAGCGAADTILQAIWLPPVGEPEGEDELQPVLEVYGGVQGATIRDLALNGGRRGLIIREESGSVTPLTVERVSVVESVRAGVVISGLATQVALVDVTVDDVAPLDSGNFGHGVSIQGGGSSWQDPSALVTIEGGSIDQASEVGLLIDHAEVEVTDLQVTGTAQHDDELGRGVQVQNNSIVSLQGLQSTGNHDAAVFLHMPLDVSLVDCVLSATGLSELADEDLPSGDGLGVTLGETWGDPGTWNVTLAGNSFVDNGRAGALVEGTGLSVVLGGDNSFAGNGLFTDGDTFPVAPETDSLCLQDGAEVDGEAVELGGDSGFPALGLNREPLALDDLAE